MSAPEPPPRAAPIAFWRAARAFLETLFQLFGGPAQIARHHVIDTRTRALIISWLHAGETMLRQLLLIEAAALPRLEPAYAARMPRACASRTTPPAALDAPESWRVSFRCFVAGPGGASGRGRREYKSRVGLHPAFPVAARLEAMLRVFNDPAPFAQRLARLIAHRPQRSADLLRAPPPKHRHAPRAAAEIPDLLAAAYIAWAKLDTS